jgi:hypothetical protein
MDVPPNPETKDTSLWVSSSPRVSEPTLAISKWEAIGRDPGKRVQILIVLCPMGELDNLSNPVATF